MIVLNNLKNLHKKRLKVHMEDQILLEMLGKIIKYGLLRQINPENNLQTKLYSKKCSKILLKELMMTETEKLNIKNF